MLLIVKIRKKKKKLLASSGKRPYQIFKAKICKNYFFLTWVYIITSFSPQGNTLICVDVNALDGGFKGLKLNIENVSVNNNFQECSRLYLKIIP